MMKITSYQIFTFMLIATLSTSLHAESLERVTYQRDDYKRKLGLAELKIERLEKEIGDLKKKIAQISGQGNGLSLKPAGSLSAASGEKLVVITSIQKNDTADLESEKEKLEEELQEAKDQMLEVRAKAKQMTAENAAHIQKQKDIAKGKYDRVRTYRSGITGYKYEDRTRPAITEPPHKASTISNMNSKAKSLETQARNLTIKVSRMNTEIKKQAMNQKITGTYENGTTVNLIFKGTSAGMVSRLKVGDVYAMTGLERSLGGSTDLLIRSMTKVRSSNISQDSAVDENTSDENFSIFK